MARSSAASGACLWGSLALAWPPLQRPGCSCCPDSESAAILSLLSHIYTKAQALVLARAGPETFAALHAPDREPAVHDQGRLLELGSPLRHLKRAVKKDTRNHACGRRIPFGGPPRSAACLNWDSHSEPLALTFTRLQAVLGGNSSPSTSDIESILSSGA